ncbi:MAG: EthD family reductase [Deltaproteobacteria bacterium]|nr:EthD family reductase [Deltaproteobacteria bacterium]
MIRATVFYPSGEGRFDMEYYLNSHIPLAERLLKPYGLIRAEVDKGIAGGGPGEAAPFATIAYMIFENMEGLTKGMAAHDAEMAADVKNFTDLKPFFQISEILR